MDLIVNIKMVMMWKNIVIVGVINRFGGVGVIIFIGFVIDYVVFNNIKVMIFIL